MGILAEDDRQEHRNAGGWEPQRTAPERKQRNAQTQGGDWPSRGEDEVAGGVGVRVGLGERKRQVH